jgi:hypothetical protein
MHSFSFGYIITAKTSYLFETGSSFVFAQKHLEDEDRGQRMKHETKKDQKKISVKTPKLPFDRNSWSPLSGFGNGVENTLATISFTSSAWNPTFTLFFHPAASITSGRETVSTQNKRERR